MKDAYSLALGDVVQADELDYGMCEEFVVLCPCCCENVIKKTRARQDGGVTHYLAHRARSPEDAQECERRVAAMSHDDIRSVGALLRGQTLDRFFAAFERIVLESIAVTTHTTDGTPVKEMLDAMRDSAVFKQIFHEMVAYTPKMAMDGPGDRLDEIALSTITGSKDRITGKVIPVSPRMRETMAHLAKDIRLHVGTAQGRENLRTLLAAGAFRRSFDSKPLDSHPYSQIVVTVTGAIGSASKLKFAQIRRSAAAAIRANPEIYENPAFAKRHPDAVLASNIFLDLFTLGTRYAIMSPFASQMWKGAGRNSPDFQARLREALEAGGVTPLPPGLR